jgi:predicted nucleic acid-binding protein
VTVDAKELRRIVVTDSSVLINLHHTSHLELVRRLPTFQFVIPEEVIAEITEPTQAQLLNQLVADGRLETVSLESAEELTLFADLSSRLGFGESACLAIARSRGWLVACDEKRIF